MNGDNGTRRLANNAATDVRLYGWCRYWHHGHSLTGGEPVAVVIPRRVLALAKDVAEQVRHRGELLETRARTAEVLSMRRVVALDVQVTVAVPEFPVGEGAAWYIGTLAVFNDNEASRKLAVPWWSRNSTQPPRAAGSSAPSLANLSWYPRLSWLTFLQRRQTGSSEIALWSPEFTWRTSHSCLSGGATWSRISWVTSFSLISF